VEPSQTSDQIVLDHISPSGPVVTQVRGALITASMEALREGGYFDAYQRALPPAARDEIVNTLAMSWVSIERALEHYRACDALSLHDRHIAELATKSSARYASSFFGTLLRTTRNTGFDLDWASMRMMHKMFERVYMGGGMTVYRIGPKDTLTELHGVPLAQSRYYRVACQAWYQGIGELVVKKLYVRQVRPRVERPYTIALASSWV
jgi:hypothetical protein